MTLYFDCKFSSAQGVRHLLIVAAPIMRVLAYQTKATPTDRLKPRQANDRKCPKQNLREINRSQHDRTMMALCALCAPPTLKSGVDSVCPFLHWLKFALVGTRGPCCLAGNTVSSSRFSWA